ncbi:hypothetical protein Asulf_01925 [Archaeoglobus sulfaticallidus PM70-1]|uniref:Uncharacterized protein n=1 Tax=Archaeoglobus sulfaticallidus PM70-1 TaxID=387631 RepID=N0BMN6_9EURY|nr:hypothetical protein [Archaeoglobus sulfaticallidus]AGK61891.1 hypothetical protein Asulf_01925 [Archaeoglobus sulfaticallidus PM70-1]
MEARYHMVIAFTLAVLLVGFGVLLSPPFKDLRKSIGLPEDLPGSRYANGVAEIINPDIDQAELYLTRIAHIYHAVFAVLIYATIAALVKIYRMETDILLLMLTGVLMVVAGSIVYAYIDHTFFWHGLFIAGLAVIFSSALLLLFRFKPSEKLDWAVLVAGLLLLGGAVIGGWVGSSFIDSNLAHEFLIAKIQSRFNPDLAEESTVWRAMTGHLHAMVALSLALAFVVAVKAVGVRQSRLTQMAVYAVIFGETVMALASYSVWFAGKIAHLIITPAALALIFGTLMLSFRTERPEAASPKGALSWGLRLGNLWVWAFVAVPGAIVAISLRKPKFFNPEFRAESWDWAELAYNIGHWHILLAIWGVTLLLVYLAIVSKSRFAAIAGWTATIGMLGSIAAVNLYMLANPPLPYVPNPYDNFWLQYFVEPSMAIMSLGVAASYFVFLKDALKGDT